MKKHQKICLGIVIFFCIDYSISSLLGFDLVLSRIQDMHLIHSIYACVVGICGFISILIYKKED